MNTDIEYNIPVREIKMLKLFCFLLICFTTPLFLFVYIFEIDGYKNRIVIFSFSTIIFYLLFYLLNKSFFRIVGLMISSFYTLLLTIVFIARFYLPADPHGTEQTNAQMVMLLVNLALTIFALKNFSIFNCCLLKNYKIEIKNNNIYGDRQLLFYSLIFFVFNAPIILVDIKNILHPLQIINNGMFFINISYIICLITGVIFYFIFIHVRKSFLRCVGDYAMYAAILLKMIKITYMAITEYNILEFIHDNIYDVVYTNYNLLVICVLLLLSRYKFELYIKKRDKKLGDKGGTILK